MKKAIWILFVLFTGLNSFAQKNITQLKNQIYQQLVGLEGSDYYSEGRTFIQHLDQDELAKEDQENLLKLFAMLRKKKFASKAVYLNLFRIFNAYQQTTLSQENFQTLWYNIGLDIQDNYFDRADIVLENAGSFLKNNSFYQNANYQWFCSNGNWSISDNIYLSINFINADIHLVSDGKTFNIHNVTGEFKLDDGIFFGSEGTINWEQYGIPASKRKAKLNRFEIQTTQANFFAENVLVQDKSLSQEDLIGNLRYRGESHNQMIFESYEMFPLKNFHPTIEAITGIKLVDGDFTPYAPKYTKMKFLLYDKEQKQLEIATRKFKLQENTFIAKEAKFKYFFKQDSISHPMIDFEFNIDEGLFHASVPDNPIGRQTPFEDSYHDIHILADHCYWDESTNQLIFENKEMSQLVPVKYQSLRYFHPDWFLSMFGMENVHPTSLLKRLSKQNNWARNFNLVEVQEIYQLDPNTLHGLLVEFTNHGFIDYDPVQEYVVIKDRFFTFYEGLKKKKDHDQLRIISNINNRPSGIIDLESGVLDIYKVKEVSINTNQMTSIYPEDEIIHIYENMDMSFSGTTICSKFAFFGTEQYFDYDEYSFHFDAIDSVRYLLELPINDSIHIQPCNTVIQEFTGVLEIDRPNNKSSKKKLKQYPKLTTEEKSYVFYELIKEGIYEREEFYFELEPFKLSALKKLKTTALTFEGKLVSANIFPEIQETLVLNKQQELGFKHKTKGKYSLYQKGKYSNIITLTNNGLTGVGQMDYNGLYLTADSVEFYPNYAFAEVSKSTTRPALAPFSIPSLKGTDLRMDWFIEASVLELKNKLAPFELYSNHSLNGGLEMTDTALNAYGTLATENIICHSGNIQLKNQAWKALNSSLRLFQSPTISDFHTDEVILSQDNIQLIYLNSDRKLISGTKGVSNNFLLPINQYQLSMERMSYELASDNINFETKDSLLIGSYTSIHPYQDSLEIWGNKAQLNLSDLSLSFEDIRGVKVADALIKPKQKILSLNEIGFLDSLNDASLQLIDTGNQVKYQFHKANVNIYGKNDYQANADFVYTNRIGNQQTVHFEDIHVSEKGKSFGVAELESKDAFFLDPQISFEGTLTINDELGVMMADGKTQFHDPCAVLEGPSFTYVDSLDKFKAYLIEDEEMEITPFCSFMVNPKTLEFYPAFCTNSKSDLDLPLLTVEGTLDYEFEGDYYKIKGKHAEEHASLTQDCNYLMEGFFKLSHSKFVSDLSYGSIQWEQDKETPSQFELHLGIDFPIAEKALKWMRKDIVRKLKHVEQSDEDQQSFSNFLAAVIGKEQSKRYFKAKAKGRYFVHPSMRNDLFFTGLNMVWNKDLEVFESSEEYLSLNHVNGTKVDRLVKGNVQYRPDSEGDYWYFYLEFEEGGYYFLEIDGNILYTYSSEDKYNRLIQKKTKDKKKKGERFKTTLSPDFKR